MAEYTPEEIEIMTRAIYHYGGDAQTMKAVEELSELQQALCKYLCTKSAPAAEWQQKINNIVEEIADVEIMLQQIRLIFNIREGHVENIKNSKLGRLTERMAADEEKERRQNV